MMRAKLISTFMIASLFCLPIDKASFSTAAQAQAPDQVDWYVNQINAVASGFKRVYCPAQPSDIENTCRNTPIIVNRSLEVNAYARRRDGQDVITINVGLASILDQMEQARVASIYITPDFKCFNHWMDTVVRGIAENTERARLGLRFVENIQVFGAYGPHDPACRGVNVASVRRVTSEHGVNYAKGIESGLALIILHELGHVVNGHTRNPPRSVAESRQQETQADDFIAPAAARAGQPIIMNLELLFMMATQGGNLDWERNSDHPLGVRRALRIYSQFRQQLLTSPALGRKLSPEQIDSGVRYLDRMISTLRSCVDLVQEGQQCAHTL